MCQIIKTGKQGLNGFIQDLVILLFESIMDLEREERSRPEYQPLDERVYEWAYQKGSVYIWIVRVKFCEGDDFDLEGVGAFV